jgi:hypothetical protein
MTTQNTNKPEGTTHTSSNGTHFKQVSAVRPNGEAMVCKWIKSRKAWSKPQAYINWK